MIGTISDPLRSAYAEVGVDIEGDRVLIADVPVGRYFVALRTTEIDLVTPVTLSSLSASVSNECGAAGVLDLDAGIGEISLFIRGNDVHR